MSAGQMQALTEIPTPTHTQTLIIGSIVGPVRFIAN